MTHDRKDDDDGGDDRNLPPMQSQRVASERDAGTVSNRRQIRSGPQRDAA